MHPTDELNKSTRLSSAFPKDGHRATKTPAGSLPALPIDKHFPYAIDFFSWMLGYQKCISEIKVYLDEINFSPDQINFFISVNPNLFCCSSGGAILLDQVKIYQASHGNNASRSHVSRRRRPWLSWMMIMHAPPIPLLATTELSRQLDPGRRSLICGSAVAILTTICFFS